MPHAVKFEIVQYSLKTFKLIINPNINTNSKINVFVSNPKLKIQLHVSKKVKKKSKKYILISIIVKKNLKCLNNKTTTRTKFLNNIDVHVYK